jgi:hypothetical protein
MLEAESTATDMGPFSDADVPVPSAKEPLPPSEPNPLPASVMTCHGECVLAPTVIDCIDGCGPHPKTVTDAPKLGSDEGAHLTQALAVNAELGPGNAEKRALPASGETRRAFPDEKLRAPPATPIWFVEKVGPLMPDVPLVNVNAEVPSACAPER